MIPLSDDNPTLRTPIMTYLLVGLIIFFWIVVQGGLKAFAYFSGGGLAAYELAIASSVCSLGLIPGEITGLARVGDYIPMGRGLACPVDANPINILTPLTSMFLHGSWGHIAGNLLFFWVFGNNVEDSMGRLRFLIFYLLCGFAAAGAQVATSPASIIPMVGASGAISGVMGAYLVLYPRVRVNMLFIIFIIIRVIPIPAWAVLLWWFGVQLFSGLPGMLSVGASESGGVAYAAHIGGFVAGVALIKLFERKAVVAERNIIRHRLHPDHP